MSSPEGLRGPVLVTGTDTGVGKTIVTAAIAAAAGAAGLRVAVIKPAQTGTAAGEETDVQTVRRLAAPASARTLRDYPEPLAPLAAARVAGLPAPDLGETIDAVRQAASDHDLVLVEGAGGLRTPMGGAYWHMTDMAGGLGMRVVVVARAGLGTLNHTSLTVHALRLHQLTPYLVIGAWPAEPELVHRQNLIDLAVLATWGGILPEGVGGLEPAAFRVAASSWLAPALYGRWTPPVP